MTIWFGPKAPASRESNWVQAMPEKGWSFLTRLYAPPQPWFDTSPTVREAGRFAGGLDRPPQR
ncbi:DUF1214 domain-containing protein [Inquilinus sp. OTU3971]|uniref:DUF1214 domain-containing protein n=1 Tax=Inquilinus sp. OTU3971 TaxID=3043855 RepID=UPI00406C777F